MKKTKLGKEDEKRLVEFIEKNNPAAPRASPNEFQNILRALEKSPATAAAPFWFRFRVAFSSLGAAAATAVLLLVLWNSHLKRESALDMEVASFLMESVDGYKEMEFQANALLDQEVGL